MIFLSGIRIVNMCEQLFLGIKITLGAMCTGGILEGKGQNSFKPMLECEVTEYYKNIYHEFSADVTQYIGSYISQITMWQILWITT